MESKPIINANMPNTIIHKFDEFNASSARTIHSILVHLNPTLISRVLKQCNSMRLRLAMDESNSAASPTIMVLII